MPKKPTAGEPDNQPDAQEERPMETTTNPSNPIPPSDPADAEPKPNADEEEQKPPVPARGPDVEPREDDDDEEPQTMTNAELESSKHPKAPEHPLEDGTPVPTLEEQMEDTKPAPEGVAMPAQDPGEPEGK